MSVLKYFLIFALLAGLSSVSLADTVVATVNGHKIMKKQFERYLKFREGTSQHDLSHNKKDILQELINRELLMQQVKKKKLDKNPELNYLIQQQKINIYIQALMRQSDVAKPVPESEVKALYNQKVKNHKLEEYKISHILVKTEQDAKDVIADLDKGAKFADEAKKKSTGPSAKEGGELGWLNVHQLNGMPSFAQAVAELKKGDYTKKPVKTKYGWHVVKLEDKREQSPPSLKEVHKQLVAALREQRMQKYVKSLRDSAKIHIHMK